jgi:hypothetical protein
MKHNRLCLSACSQSSDAETITSEDDAIDLSGFPATPPPKFADGPLFDDVFMRPAGVAFDNLSISGWFYIWSF